MYDYSDLLEGEYRSRAFPIESTSNRRNPQSANAFGRGFMEDRASAYKGTKTGRGRKKGDNNVGMAIIIALEDC